MSNTPLHRCALGVVWRLGYPAYLALILYDRQGGGGGGIRMHRERSAYRMMLLQAGSSRYLKSLLR